MLFLSKNRILKIPVLTLFLSILMLFVFPSQSSFAQELEKDISIDSNELMGINSSLETTNSTATGLSKETTDSETTELSKETTNSTATELSKETTDSETTELSKETTNSTATELSKETTDSETTELSKETTDSETTELSKETTNSTATELSKETTDSETTELSKETTNSTATELSKETTDSETTELSKETTDSAVTEPSLNLTSVDSTLTKTDVNKMVISEETSNNQQISTINNVQLTASQQNFIKAKYNGVAVYSPSYLGSRVMGKLNEGYEFKVYRNDVRWIAIEFGKYIGFVSATDISFSDGATVPSLPTNQVAQKNVTFTKEKEVYISDSTTSGMLGRISKGEDYPIIGMKNEFYQVKIAGRIGYIHKTEFEPSDRYLKVQVDNTPVYSPSTEGSRIMAKLSKGQEFFVYKYSPRWIAVKFGNGIGYISEADILPVSTISVSTTNNLAVEKNLTLTKEKVVYVSDSTTSAMLGRISKGETYPILGMKNGFYQISIAGRTGYIQKTEFEENDTTFIANKENINVYASNSETSKVKGYLQLGEKYKFTSINSNWLIVNFGDSTAYIKRSDILPGDDNNLYNPMPPFKKFRDISITEKSPVYSLNSVYSKPIGYVNANEIMHYYYIKDGFYVVNYLGRQGYIVKPGFDNKDTLFVVKNDNTNIYSSKSLSSNSIGSLNRGHEYLIKEYSPGWITINFGNQEGYLSEVDVLANNERYIDKYIVTEAPISTIKINSTQNLKVNPYDESSVISTVKAGNVFSILGVENDFLKVDLAGRVAYLKKTEMSVDTKFITTIKSDAPIYFRNSLGKPYEAIRLSENVELKVEVASPRWLTVYVAGAYGSISANDVVASDGTSLNGLSVNKPGKFIGRMVRDANIYSSTSANSKMLGTIVASTPITLSGFENDYVAVYVGDQPGYIPIANITFEEMTGNLRNVSAFYLPVYRTYDELANYQIHLDSNYVRYAELNYGDKVLVLSRDGYASQVQLLNGMTGWVQNDYLTEDLYKRVWITRESANLYKEAGSENSSIGVVNYNEKVIIYEVKYLPNSTKKLWARIQTTDGKFGWVWSSLRTGSSNKTNIMESGYRFFKEIDSGSTNSINIFSKLNTLSTVSEETINSFIDFKVLEINKSRQQRNLDPLSSVMTGMGYAFIKAQYLTGINAIYLLAHAGHETAWGTSPISNGKYNYYGINVTDTNPDDGYSYSTKEGGIVEGATWIRQNYIYRAKYVDSSKYYYNQITLDNMRNDNSWHQYATDEAWAVKIVKHARDFTSFLVKQVNNKASVTVKKIVIDPGHGGSDSGAPGNGFLEKDIVLKLALKTQYYLNTYYTGHEVRLTRTGDNFISLIDRANMANNWGADVFVSIHLNAFNGAATGYEDYRHSTKTNGVELQNTMHQHIASIYKSNGIQDRGKKERNYAVLRETKMPAILTENGFIDNSNDMAKMKQDWFQNKVAKAHADGIAEFLGLQRK